MFVNKLCSWSPQHPAYCMNLANLGETERGPCLGQLGSYTHLIALIRLVIRYRSGPASRSHSRSRSRPVSRSLLFQLPLINYIHVLGVHCVIFSGLINYIHVLGVHCVIVSGQIDYIPEHTHVLGESYCPTNYLLNTQCVGCTLWAWWTAYLNTHVY